MGYHFRLLVVDVDGTIVTPSTGIPPEVINSLRACESQDVMVVVATGKHLFSVRDLCLAIQANGPVITCNGAITADVSSGRILQSSYLPSSDYLKLVESLESDSRAAVAVFTKRDIVGTGENFATASLRAIGEYAGRRVRSLVEVAGESVAKVLVASPSPDMLYVMHRDYREHFIHEFSITFTSDIFLEFMAPGVSKGRAVHQIAVEKGIKTEEIICIGDSENDLSMFGVAGVAVAVANASPAVLEAAQLIVPAAADGGVALAIKRLILGKT